MKGLLVLILLVVLVGGAMKAAGLRLPLVDYPIGPIGIHDARGPAMPDVRLEPPGLGDFPNP